MKDTPGDTAEQIARWFDPPFEVIEPVAMRAPVIFNSPHSGRIYPDEFVSRSRLDPHSLRRSEDCYIDEVFLNVADLGAPLMRANFPRAFLDVNREAYELDPLMFTDPLPDFVNTASVRVAGGLGTIARVVSETEEIYREPLTFAEAEARIRTLHIPYHQHLTRRLVDARNMFGAVVLIDCHSMPSSVPSQGATEQTVRPDIIIGDRYGSSCGGAIVDMVEQLLIGMGYSVSRNRPYAGGFITQTYGRPVQAMHALQLEINRSLYMHEARLAKHAGFYRLCDDIYTLVSRLVEELPGLLRVRQAAAE